MKHAHLPRGSPAKLGYVIQDNSQHRNLHAVWGPHVAMYRTYLSRQWQARWLALHTQRVLPCLQMNEMVAKTEETAIPVSEVVNVIVEAATTAQPQVGPVAGCAPKASCGAQSCYTVGCNQLC